MNINKEKAKVYFKGKQIGILKNLSLEQPKPTFVVVPQFAEEPKKETGKKFLVAESFEFAENSYKELTRLKDSEDLSNLFQQKDPFEVVTTGSDMDEIITLQDCWISGYNGMEDKGKKKVAFEVKISFEGDL